MKYFLSYWVSVLFFIIIGTGVKSVYAQTTNVIDPNDPIVIYDPLNPPTQPVSGQVGKWVKTNRLPWNTTSYKCYIYKGVPFRLKFPKNYDSTQSYPLFLFFHGRGEFGQTIYDDEYQLALGGQQHMNAVDQGKLNAFLLYPQNQAGGWSTAQLTIIDQLIENILIPQVKVDPFRIFLDGLSAGGNSAWYFFRKYTKLIAAFTPISSATTGYADSVKKYRFTPIWHFQGALDNNPAPGVTKALGDKILAAGGNYLVTVFATRGHDCWYQAWAMPDYFPFYNRAHKANPWPVGGRFEFCPGDPVLDTLGVTPGFDGYEWRKDGVTIPGANQNILVVTQLGTYDCRIKRGNTWSVYSPTPAVIKLKSVTVSPNIQTSGSQSYVLPSVDGSTNVTLQVPNNYVSYIWQKDGDTTTLSSTNTLTVSTPGFYKVMVTEKFGCSSNFSPLFPVVNANGINSPAPVVGLIAGAVSKTAIQLNWSQNSNPLYNETGFEIYQATSINGPYNLVAIAPADSSNIIIDNLTSGIKYFYKIRPINNNGAAPVTGPASATTQSDTTAPSAPSNLRVFIVTRNSVELDWDPSTDDVDVAKYDVYVNGVKTYVTEATGYTVNNLKQNQTYKFTVRARDAVDNNSPFSNQVTATTHFTGLSYKIYHGLWNALPNFSTLTPMSKGFIHNVDVSPRAITDTFAFLWEGYITIPVNGSYTFRLTSDDGSRLWLSTYNFSNTPLINNDGVHIAQTVDGTITLNAGVYPISIAYFDRTSTDAISLLWKTPQTNGSFLRIPDSAFKETPVANGQPPSNPSNLTATALAYNKISLSWNDNSNNETGFEILRSKDRFTNFSSIVKTAPNLTTYVDSLVDPNTTYYYRVRAVNQFGESGFDKDKGNGVDFAYYENNSTALTVLPDFSTLVPVKVGRVAAFSLGTQLRANNYEIKFDGFINIPAAGTYNFYTNSDAGSKLYIGGFSETNLVVNNDNVHGNVEKKGTKTFATAGLYPITVTYFIPGGPAALSVSIDGPGLAKQNIPVSMLGTPFVNATSLPLPNAPVSSGNLVASAISTSKVNITWTDNATNESRYEVYRSTTNNTSYVLIASLPANSQSYQDSGLFANSIFYYKVKAVNVGGAAPSNEDSAKTFNDLPVITHVTNRFMRYGTQIQVPLVATDIDPESLSFNFGTSLPTFASFIPGNNGQGSLSFSPQQLNNGTYNIRYTVNDQNGGSAIDSFQLTVSDNYNPVISPISNISLNEKKTAQINLTATDQNPSDQLTWSFEGLPSFATVSASGGNAAINLAPGYADAQVYTVKAKVNDGRNGLDSAYFTITVNDVLINRRYLINFNYSGSVAVWNNLIGIPALGFTRTAFKDSLGAVSTVGLKVISNWVGNGGTYGTGLVTGNNSGVFPDAVIKQGWYVKNKQTWQFTGLDTSLLYNLTFFGDATSTVPRVGVYIVNGIRDTLDAANNTTKTVSIRGIKPNADSTITVDMQNAAGSSYAYINSMVVESGLDDGTLPAAPINLKAVYNLGKTTLTWNDVPYNENGFEIYRSSDPNGTFTLLVTTPANASSYSDTTINGLNTYYYKIRAINNYGSSNYTSVVRVDVPNIAPILNGIVDQRLRVDQSVTVNITTIDNATDTITITGANLPSFATLTDNRNGTASLTINPNANNIGVFNNLSIIASDNHGGTTTINFTITVASKEVNSIYVNFNSSLPYIFPWNNFTVSPSAGKVLSNLKDEMGVGTGINVTLEDKWTSASTAGMVTGTNSGIFPDTVLKTYYYESTPATKRILLSGLSPAKKYNLSFLPSVNRTGTIITNYTVGGQTIGVNAAGNISNVARFNGISPDTTGKIEISIAKKDSATLYAYINAMVIQSYDTGTLVAPTALVALGVSKSQINLNWIDNSVETGFEIWRATSSGGTYSLVGTTGANVTSYSDNGLAENTYYYYKVRAITSAKNSSYSNVASSGTSSYIVYINFNFDNPADFPWNNTNSLPEQLSVYPNLQNDLGNPAGVDMSVPITFSGVNPNGMITGNNSGVFPDNVMRSTWYNGKGVTSQLQIDGLSQVNEYNFIFFASRNGGGDRTTIYTIGNQSVSLNASFNTQNTVQINHVKPDENGSVLITVSLGPIAQFGYLGALVIQGYTTQDSINVQGFNVIVKNNPNSLTPNQNNLVDGSVESPVTENKVEAYPNPFRNNVELKVATKEKVPLMTVKILDISGRVIRLYQYKDIPQGRWQQKIDLSNSTIQPGVYLIQIEGLSDNKTRIVKLIKTK